MRNVWATVLAVWALVAVVAILAWTRPQSSSSSGQTIVVNGKQGVGGTVLQTGGTHATTRTSRVPAG
jgi:cyanate permease